MLRLRTSVADFSVFFCRAEAAQGDKLNLDDLLVPAVWCDDSEDELDEDDFDEEFDDDFEDEEDDDLDWEDDEEGAEQLEQGGEDEELDEDAEFDDE